MREIEIMLNVHFKNGHDQINTKRHIYNYASLPNILRISNCRDGRFKIELSLSCMETYNRNYVQDHHKDAFSF